MDMKRFAAVICVMHGITKLVSKIIIVHIRWFLALHTLHHKCTLTSFSRELNIHSGFLTYKREILIVNVHVEHVGMAYSYRSPTRSVKVFQV